MVDTASFHHLRCTPDLTEGGIAYALRTLPYGVSRSGRVVYDHLRTLVAETVVELAFRRYLSECGIPFAVKAALPFSGHDRYDVMLDGRRCELKSFLISHRQQLSQIQGDPEALLRVPVLVASDQHAAEGHSARDLYIFAFLLGQDKSSRDSLQKMVATDERHYFVHVMPEAWSRPARWHPLGRLALKSESEQMQMVELGGQDEGGSMCSCSVELPPRKRLELPTDFFSLSYVHAGSSFHARLGIHSPVRRETHIIEAGDWEDLWVSGSEILGAGYITREEFRRRARFIPAGSRLIPHQQSQVKNLAVPVSELRPLSELFERAKRSAPVTTP